MATWARRLPSGGGGGAGASGGGGGRVSSGIGNRVAGGLRRPLWRKGVCSPIPSDFQRNPARRGLRGVFRALFESRFAPRRGGLPGRGSGPENASGRALEALPDRSFEGC